MCTSFIGVKQRQQLVSKHGRPLWERASLFRIHLSCAETRSRLYVANGAISLGQCSLYSKQDCCCRVDCLCSKFWWVNFLHYSERRLQWSKNMLRLCRSHFLQYLILFSTSAFKNLLKILETRWKKNFLSVTPLFHWGKRKVCVGSMKSWESVGTLWNIISMKQCGKFKKFIA